jgi:hypothetical protein
MRCDKVRKLLSEYSIGGLGRREREIIEAHKRECTSCTEALSSYERLDALIGKAIRPIDPPDGIWDGVATRIREERRSGWLEIIRMPRRLSWAVAGAVVALLLSIGFLFGINTTRKGYDPKEIAGYMESHIGASLGSVFPDRLVLGASIMLRKEARTDGNSELE